MHILFLFQLGLWGRLMTEIIFRREWLTSANESKKAILLLHLWRAKESSSCVMQHTHSHHTLSSHTHITHYHLKLSLFIAHTHSWHTLTHQTLSHSRITRSHITRSRITRSLITHSHSSHTITHHTPSLITHSHSSYTHSSYTHSSHTQSSHTLTHHTLLHTLSSHTLTHPTLLSHTPYSPLSSHSLVLTIYSPRFTLHSDQRIYFSDAIEGLAPPSLTKIWLTKPLSALSAVYCTTCPSDREGRERLGKSNLCKTMAGAVPSITDIYSLSVTLHSPSTPPPHPFASTLPAGGQVCELGVMWGNGVGLLHPSPIGSLSGCSAVSQITWVC